MKGFDRADRNVLGFVAILLMIAVSLQAAEPYKPRVIATTDGELDDQSSMVRFLMYASDYDIAGIVQVNGVQKDGHSKDQWIEKLIAKYDACLPNLRKHRPDYPSAEYLLSVLTVGNENRQDLRKAPPLLSDSEGAQLIIRTLLDDDPRPVHILAWGGANTQANALWQIKETYSAEEWQRAAAKAVLYCIWFQDGGGKWIKENLPEIKIFEAGAPEKNGSWRYVWDYMSVDMKYKGRMSKNPKDLQAIMDTPWLMENIKQGHGPLAAAYPQDYTSEGDTPSFMALIDNGLAQHMDYTWGGWGGRPVYAQGNYMQDSPDEHNGQPDLHYTYQRWLPAAQNDWAARADWCVKPYDQANHPPVITLAHGSQRQAHPGQRVSLSAKGTTDPDGDDLTYRWWQYREAGTYEGQVQIQDADKPEASLIVPVDMNQKGTIQIVCEVTDNGSPALTRYQRVFVDVKPMIPAFPGAEGYGSLTRGGRGGQVIAVTNLEDSGPGSLRTAIEAEGPRIVVFRVSGTIPLKKRLNIRNPYITIAGQTAPGDGICLRDQQLSIGTDEVIIRYIRVRLGDESNTNSDAISGRGRNIILDHVSASWSIDECVSIYGGEYVTIQWCLIGESLYESKHKKGNHGYGGIWGNHYSSYHHNLLAHHSSRNPRWASKSRYCDFRNNVVYNWGYNSTYGGEGDTTVNMVANYYKPGPATVMGKPRYRIMAPSTSGGLEGYGHYYIADNVVEGNPVVTADNWAGGVQWIHPDTQNQPPEGAEVTALRMTEPWEAMSIRTQSPEEAYQRVLDDVGAILPKRDAVDTRIVKDARTGKATFEGSTYKKEQQVVDASVICGMIDSQSDVGGWPELISRPAPADTDGDGMPDAWETRYGLDINDPTDGPQDKDDDGYTNVEEYLNGTDPTVFVDYTKPENNVNTLM